MQRLILHVLFTSSRDPTDLISERSESEEPRRTPIGVQPHLLFASRLTFSVEMYSYWLFQPTLDSNKSNTRTCSSQRPSCPQYFLSAVSDLIRLAKCYINLLNILTSHSIILICPYWPSQPWFPSVSEFLIDRPLLLPSLPLLRCPGKPEVESRRPCGCLHLNFNNFNHGVDLPQVSSERNG